MALGKTVREIEENMSMREFQEWQTYHKDNLFPMDRNELQMAQLMKMVSPMFIKNAKVEDFLYRLKAKASKSLAKTKSVLSATADEINKLVGVKNG